MRQKYNITSEEKDNMSTITSENKSLTVNDRCDRCGVDSFGRGISQAYLKATLKSGLSLYFCRHHGTEYIESLKDSAIDIIDDRDKAE